MAQGEEHFLLLRNEVGCRLLWGDQSHRGKAPAQGGLSWPDRAYSVQLSICSSFSAINSHSDHLPLFNQAGNFHDSSGTLPPTKTWLLSLKLWAINNGFYHLSKASNAQLSSKFSFEDFSDLNPWPDTVRMCQFSRSVVSDSLRPHESQHARSPCPSQTPGVYSNSCPSSRWCHPAISSSVIPFSSCPQSLPASGSFPTSQLVTWGGQSTGVSASPSVLPMNTQDWSPLRWTGWISLQLKGLSRVFSNTIVQKHQFFGTQLSSQSNFHIHTWPLEKP